MIPGTRRNVVEIPESGGISTESLRQSSTLKRATAILQPAQLILHRKVSIHSANQLACTTPTHSPREKFPHTIVASALLR
jgi:hypothetical protein